VDLERRHSVAAHEGRWFLTAAERRLGVADLTVLWALKEAAWKALSLGQDIPFQDLELAFCRVGRLAAIRLRGRRFPARASVRFPWGGYVATVVTLEGDT
jgi:hypothetical protein